MDVNRAEDGGGDGAEDADEAEKRARETARVMTAVVFATVVSEGGVRAIARVEAEVSSGKAVLDESLARSAQAGRDSLAQLRDGWTRGVGGLVNGFGGIAPRQAGPRSSTGE